MAEKDYYAVLGVDRNSGTDEIKKAYRILVMKYHPDRNPDDVESAEQMRSINEAYAVLSAPEKRRLYDLYGLDGLSGYAPEDLIRDIDFSGLLREFGAKDAFGFGSSILSDLFGFGKQRRAERGTDLRYDLTITLEEAASGTSKNVTISKMEVCPVCKGTGAAPGGLEECDQCGGSGQIITEQRKGSTVRQDIRTCRKCGGMGTIVARPCAACKGTGFVEKTKEVSVMIPPGAFSGYAIMIKGEGATNNHIPGDLYIVVQIKKHASFERHEDDLYMEKEIPFTLAALGGATETLDLQGNPFTVTIPEGTQTGAILRIEGKGIPHLGREGRGDVYVLIKVVTPTNLDRTQKELLRRFQERELSQ